MLATKAQLINYLEDMVLIPVEHHAKVTETLKRKVKLTRMRLNQLDTPEKVEQFFWNCMSSVRGVDSYTKVKAIGGVTFEDVRFGFKKLCGRK